MTRYNWQLASWPHFQYDLSDIHESLLSIAEKSGLTSGKLAYVDKTVQVEAMIDLMIEEAIKTSEIEGEYLSRPDVRSSIINKLGLKRDHLRVQDKRAQGIVDLMFDSRNTFKQPLTETQLLDWHLMLFVGSNNPNLRVGSWRIHDEPMQIVSGHYGSWKVHFEAPPSSVVPDEMKKFIEWFNNTSPDGSQAIKYAPVRAAIAHLYFESIHPFEDGNGRIGRAIAEKALSQGFGYPVLLSLSDAIEANKKAYYEALNEASKSNEMTGWIKFFITIVLDAYIETEKRINFILQKSKFFDAFNAVLNERQLKVIRRMLQEGIKGFEGGMTAKKFMAIAATSKATATRDLQDLVAMGAFKLIGTGRSSRYELNLKPLESD